MDTYKINLNQLKDSLISASSLTFDTSTATITGTPIQTTSTTTTGTVTGTPLQATTATSTNPYNQNFTVKYNDLNTKYTFNIKDSSEFKKVEELVPFKVYRFTFEDNTVIKTVCRDDDPFDLEYAFYLALAKKKFSCSQTFEGILHKADTLRYEKYYAKIVKKGMKLFRNQQLEEAKKEDEKRLKKEQHQRYIAKKKARDERRATQAQDNLRKLITEAIKAAKEGE